MTKAGRARIDAANARYGGGYKACDMQLRVSPEANGIAWQDWVSSVWNKERSRIIDPAEEREWKARMALLKETKK